MQYHSVVLDVIYHQMLYLHADAEILICFMMLDDCLYFMHDALIDIVCRVVARVKTMCCSEQQQRLLPSQHHTQVMHCALGSMRCY